MEVHLPYSNVPLRIAQISDIHAGEASFQHDVMANVIEKINVMKPDMVVVAGDLTAAGYEEEYIEAAGIVAQIEPPKLVIPGNHDARNVGWVHFERYFGNRYGRYRQEFEPERAERLRAPGFTVVGVDSSEPDVNEGRVGRDRYPWILSQFDDPDDIKIFAIHHHLVSIPGTGRERNIVHDAGDLLAHLSTLDIDLIVSGHKHVPFFWGINGILVANSGTCSTKRLRGLTPSSWNEFEIDASTIKVFLHYPDGRRELSVIFSRKTRAFTREAFYMTQEFVTSNRLSAVL
ncbi:MAG TPA: metallophosphoesterase [Actinomycetota bacterium]|nr:metallophosphoesterase [Actinomycetota bacterium]